MVNAINEFNMLHKAAHCKSIVKVNSLMYNTMGKFLAISMEDLSSMTTLFDYCDSSHHLNKRVLVARNLCAAIAELHAIDIVHGDLASENILINDATSEVKVIDFDLASVENT